MTRRANPPAYSTVTLDKFYGMVRDRTGPEMHNAEFYDLTNMRNNNLEGLKPRPGSTKVFSETETSGSKVYGLHTFRDDSGTEIYLKACNTRIYKSTGGSWSAISGKTDFAATTHFFATLNTKDTGAANSTSGTTTSADTTSITDSGSGWTVNDYVGEVLTVNSEIKLVTANTNEKIFVSERFDEEPSSDSFTVNPRAQEFFVANGTDFYKCDGATFTRLDNSSYAFAFTGIESHASRLFGWKGTRLHWSDLGVGEHFSRNSWKDFTTPIKCVKSIGNVLIIYERNKVTAMFGDSPDNFFFQEILVGIGTNSPKSVANYHGLYQFFLDENLGIAVLSMKSLQPSDEGEEPFSISRDYINSLISAQSSANIAAACAEVDEDHYHLCIDDDWYVLNVKASNKSGFDKWIWTVSDYPNAIDANVLGHFGTKFVSGAQDNGQVYELETGTDDDGTAIATTIEKRNWNPGNMPNRKKFWALRVTQPIAGSSTTMSFSADPDGTTYGSAIETVELSTAGTDEHRYEFTGNPSDVKDTGRKISFKLTNSTGGLMTEIEQVELLFYPGIFT